jgi:DnaJ-class molecular chaperone
MNPYSVLHIENDASEKQIKSAFYKIAQRTHPDKTSDEFLITLFNSALWAYNELTDPVKKAQWDTKLKQTNSNPNLYSENIRLKNLCEKAIKEIRNLNNIIYEKNQQIIFQESQISNQQQTINLKESLISNQSQTIRSLKTDIKNLQTAISNKDKKLEEFSQIIKASNNNVLKDFWENFTKYFKK